jgi:signal peptidase
LRPRADDTATAARLLGGAIDVVVGCLAIAGMASVAWWILSMCLGLGLVSFATGSMSPEYPTGSIAVSAPIALDRVRIGDVVTVQRAGGLEPITHRVIAIDVAPPGSHAIVRLKGDANRVEDPAPYDVTALRRVVLPLPAIADALRYTGSPIVISGIATIIAGSLAWAFWPTRIRPRHRDDVTPATTPVMAPAGRHSA